MFRIILNPGQEIHNPGHEYMVHNHNNPGRGYMVHTGHHSHHNRLPLLPHNAQGNHSHYDRLSLPPHNAHRLLLPPHHAHRLMNGFGALTDIFDSNIPKFIETTEAQLSKYEDVIRDVWCHILLIRYYTGSRMSKENWDSRQKLLMQWDHENINGDDTILQRIQKMQKKADFQNYWGNLSCFPKPLTEFPPDTINYITMVRILEIIDWLIKMEHSLSGDLDFLHTYHQLYEQEHNQFPRFEYDFFLEKPRKHAKSG